MLKHWPVLVFVTLIGLILPITVSVYYLFKL